MKFTYKYPRPAVTVDILIFKLNSPTQILLIERKNEPYKKSWAFPGGFVDENESLDKAAKRELAEETNLRNIALKQFQTFGNPGRDPRGHTVSVIYWGILKNADLIKAGDDASKADWFDINNLPTLAFDHQDILVFALKHIAELNKH